MNIKVKVEKVDKENGQNVINRVAEANASTDETKEVELEIGSRTGNITGDDIAYALPIIEAIGDSGVDLITHGIGRLGAAGTILLSSGKPGRRSADMSAVLVLNDAESEKLGRFKRVKNPNAGLMEHLLTITTGKKRPVRDAVTTMNVLSVYDAKKIGIVDEIIGIKSKYEEILRPKKKGKKDEDNSDSVNE